MVAPTGLLVMAYGTASGPEDIERYYTDIRGGRTPAPEQLEELIGRYAAIGNAFPLLDTTTQQAQGIASALNARAGEDDAFRPYLGMKHSDPFIPEGIGRMREDGIERAVGVVMAPHWARMSVDAYIKRAREAIEADGGPEMTFVRSWYRRPEFVSLLAGRVSDALGRLTPEQAEGAAVIFSAHSLPVETMPDGTDRCLRCVAHACQSRCEYHFELQDTADLVVNHLELKNEVSIAWQSAGRTADPWWGPPIESVITQRAADGFPAVLVCSAGFVSDHLEILFDLDIEAKELAHDAGIAFVRTEMPNADPAFCEAVAAAIRAHLDEEGF